MANIASHVGLVAKPRSSVFFRVPIIDVYGHDQLRQRLAAAVDRESLPASLLFQGPRGVGKQRLALWLGQLLLCAGPDDDASSRRPRTGPCGKCRQCRYALELTHPDLLWVFPRPRPKDSDPSLKEVREDYAEAIAERVADHGLYAPGTGSEGIFVASVRAIVQAAALSPAIARRKVFVIGDAERMVPQTGTEHAANAFLKLLEEPPPDTTLILTSSEPGGLLPTIRSRVVSVAVPLVSDEAVQAFVEDGAVRAALREEGKVAPTQELVRTAAGAPGRLLDLGASNAARLQASKLLEASISRDRSHRHRAALSQGASGARGRFSDTLDALTVLLHERARTAAAKGDETGASGAALAIEAVELAKEQALGNVSPQLVAASLLRRIGGHLS